MQNRYRRLLVVIVLLWATAGVAGRALALTFTEFQLPKGSGPIDITTGPDSAMWFTDGTGLRVGRITTAGEITEFPMPIPPPGGFSGAPFRITAGPDGALWFTAQLSGNIRRITTAGVITEFPSGTLPYGITTG